ncbi:hypothetical protein ACQKLP_17700 [Chitinophaga sp. NPDC101104]|uniref:hypothetical protein n=1 Tax=Chitinophaga sp. NPDC101104 TaxID=3390561 RepID=UPI003D078F3B
MFSRPVPVILLGICLLFTVTVRAQQILGQTKFEYSPKTPEMAAMQQFLDFPVSYFTGIPNISIPLLKIPSKSQEVNISISYQGGGIRADQQTGAVGLGWTLNAGGMITRTVRGNPDEGIGIKTTKDTTRQWNSNTSRWDTTIAWGTETSRLWYENGWQGGRYIDNGMYFDLPALYATLTANNQAVKNSGTPNTTGLERYYARLSDGEPDIFYFNFGGQSGKFFFNGREAILLPHNPDIRITPIFIQEIDELKNTRNYFDGFVINMADGTEYRFGETPSAKISGEVGWNSGFSAPNGWALTMSIDRTSKDTVRFEYEQRIGLFRKPAVVQAFITQSNFDACSNLWGGLKIDRFNEARLTRVLTRKAEARLYYSDIRERYAETSRLDSIRMFDRVTALPDRKVQFDYGNFKSGRMKLQTCLTIDKTNKVVMPYQFGYYDTAFRKDPSAPAEDFYSPYCQDYWGFYNDSIRNDQEKSLILQCGNSGNRKAAWPQMQRDALVSVTYPTGNKTIMEYEPHDFSSGRKFDGTIGAGDFYSTDYHHNFDIGDIVGGLRIKRVLNYDPLRGDTLIRRITYRDFTNPANSSGHLDISPSLITSVLSYCSVSNTPRYLVSSHNLQQSANGEGHIGYRYVTVTEEKGGAGNGRTEYEFFNDLNTDSSFYFNVCDSGVNNCIIGNYDIITSWQPKRTMQNLLYGMEKAKRIYSQAGQLLQESRTNYRAIKYGGMTRAVVMSAGAKNEICGTTPVFGEPQQTVQGRPVVLAPNLSFQFVYSYIMGKMAVLPKEMINDTYTTTGLKKTDTIFMEYNSPFHLNPTKKLSRSSEGDLRVEESYFSRDFTDLAGDSTFKYLRKGGYNIPVATFQQENGKVTAGGYRKYKMAHAVDSVSILPKEEFALLTEEGELPSSLNLTSTYPKQLNYPAAKFIRIANLDYDVNNNVIQLTGKGGSIRSITWDYDNTSAVSETKNAAITEVAYSSFETAANGRWSGSALRISGGIMGEKAYNLTNGALTVSGLPAGKEYLVSYWSNGAAATVNGVAAAQGPLKQGWRYYEHILPSTTTSVTVSGTVAIDELRLYPRQASMNTFAYAPLSGVTEMATPNGILQYEYDGMGRLWLLRDLDGNITKSAEYFYAGFDHTNPVWLNSGVLRCKPCAANTAYNDTVRQAEQIDFNPRSSTFNTKRWSDIGVSTACTNNAAWQNTATATRCKVSGGSNTGEIEQEQKDMNPCSATYNTIRWVVIGVNTTTCVPCTGVNKKMINGVCETGVRVNLSTVNVSIPGQIRHKCTYRYEWSDCSKSPNYEEIGPQPCTLNVSCDFN